MMVKYLMVIVQCNVYCCRHQSEVARLRSANSGLQDELDSVRQKLQEGESVRAKVGQRLLVLLLVIVHCSFQYDDKFGHHILWLVLRADCLCCCYKWVVFSTSPLVSIVTASF